MGRVRVDWRIELGLPLLALGALVAGAAVVIPGAGVVFWVGAGLTAIGAALFLTPPGRR